MVYIPISKLEFNAALQNNIMIQNAFSNFQGTLLPNFPKGKLWDFLKTTPFVVNSIISESPIPEAPTYYIDGNKQGYSGIVGPHWMKRVKSPFPSVQRAELYALYLLLECKSSPFNVLTDSLYIASMFPNFVTAPLSSSDLELTQLFLSVQTLIQSLLCSFYITHIRAHSALPGPLTAGNNKVDKLISALFSSPKEEHELLHTNANHLHGHYHISLSVARDIVLSCSVCSPLHQRMSPSGANPCGLHPNELWQADFTHFSLSRTSLLFVVVDTHSGFIWAVPASSESTKAAIQGLLIVCSFSDGPTSHLEN